MTDDQRIEALFEEGRLTRQQADELLLALSGLDGDQPVQTVASAAAEKTSAEPAPAARAAERPREPLALQRPFAPAAGATAREPAAVSGSKPAAGQAGSDLAVPRWLDLSLLAGNITVTVDPGISEPESDGDLMLEKTETGMKVEQWPRDSRQGFLDNILDGARMADLDLRLPASWALRLNVKAGNVDISGPLRQLAGRVHAGDVDVEEVHAIDLKLSAGNVTAGLLLQDGKHRISSSAGNLNTRLLAGSSVRIDGSVRIGNISSSDGLKRQSRGLGASISGSVGTEPAAELELRLTTGDLKIEWQNGQ